MKFASWNVNGLRACYKKGFADSFAAISADIFGLQETKMQEGQLELELEGYEQFWNSAEKKGYSGTAVFTKFKPMSINYGIGQEAHDKEGRVITLEYDNLYFVNVYTPNSQNELKRLDYRMTWEDAFLNYLKGLDSIKPVVICGDLNVAHNEIDLRHPRANRRNAGFTDEERGKMTNWLNAGFIDTYRYLYPEKKDAYTWWSFRANARANNTGWRIDYFITSASIADKISEAEIYSDIEGSDHCPVGLVLDI